MAAYLNCPVKDLRDNIKELAKGIEKVRSISEGLGDPKAITEAMQKDAKRKLVRIAREMSNGVEGFEFVIGTYETIRILKRTINVAKNSAKTVKAANARLKEAYRSSEFYEKQLQKKVEKLKKKTAKPAEKINEKKRARRKSTVEAARTNSRKR